MQPDSYSAKARAYANIAIAKYWGKRDESLNLPQFDSLSVNLSALYTDTEVSWLEGGDDQVFIDDRPQGQESLKRLRPILDEVRQEKGWTRGCLIRSWNNFPSAAGLASSASGAAALAVAASLAAQLQSSEAQLSARARLGSASAARSLCAGWSRLSAKPSHEESYAQSIAGPEHWKLCAFVVKLSREAKAVSSREAMRRSQASPYWPAYLEAQSDVADKVQAAILAKDFKRFAQLCHQSCLRLHALLLSLDEPLCYMLPQSLEILRRCLRQSQAIPVCCTLDAGPNVVIFCESLVRPFVLNDILAMGVDFVESGIAGGAHALS